MVGTASSPMVTTVAPTMPVDAPSNAPTTTALMASPPPADPSETHGRADQGERNGKAGHQQNRERQEHPSGQVFRSHYRTSFSLSAKSGVKRIPKFRINMDTP
jgi:hypothetical protein